MRAAEVKNKVCPATDSQVLKEVLLVGVNKGWWASPEFRAAFPNRCHMTLKWGHSSRWRNAVLFFPKVLLRIWLARPKAVLFGAAGRIVVFFIWLRRLGLFRKIKFIVDSHMFYDGIEARFWDRIIMFSTSDFQRSPVEYQNRYRFIPLPQDSTQFAQIERAEGDYIFSGGIAGRDFTSLIEAVSGLPYTLKIVGLSRSRLGYAKPLPENVEFYEKMPLQNFLTMMAQSKLVVIPLKNDYKGHGHTSIIQAFHLGKAVISTRGASCDDYLVEGENALVVDAGDVEGYREAIETLYHDDVLRHTLGQRALESAAPHTYPAFTDAVIALCEEVLVE